MLIVIHLGDERPYRAQRLVAAEVAFDIKVSRLARRLPEVLVDLVDGYDEIR